MVSEAVVGTVCPVASRPDPNDTLTVVPRLVDVTIVTCVDDVTVAELMVLTPPLSSTRNPPTLLETLLPSVRSNVTTRVALPVLAMLAIRGPRP